MNFEDLDHWYYELGFNVIPIILKSKQSLISWKEWQEKFIPKEDYEEWKKKEFVNNNCAIITGKIYRGQYRDKYVCCIDIDNKLGINEFLSHCGEIKTLEELAQKTTVVQHEDTKDERAHIYFITEIPLSKKTRISNVDTDDEIPVIEVKTDSSTYVVCPPSIHQNGYQYQIIGTKQIQVLNEEKCQKLEDVLNKIYEKYSSNNYNPSTGNFSYLTDELKNIIKALRIDNLNFKISNGTRNNTLLSFADSLLSNHYNLIDNEYLNSFFIQANQRLCETPLEEKELETIWAQATSFIKRNTVDKQSFKNSENLKSKGGYSQINDDSKHKKEYTVFKYTSNNHIYESVVIAGKPFFITFDKEGLKIVDKIEQETRILKPPYLEEYPSKPYVFENKVELEKFVIMVKEKNISIDSLFWKINEFVSKFIVHHSPILDYISSLILFSYFQDKFATVPCTMFVSDGGSGKSTIGNVFEDLGYRTVNMTDPTTANIFRIFGIIEEGQCTLVLDEAEKIDQDKEMMSILKTGYENGKRVQRVNQFGKQEHFHTFGLKILIAERTPNPSYAKGVIDRTFIISNYKGKPRLDIKEIRKPKTFDQRKISMELEFLRKSLFIYRLVHFEGEIIDIETGIEGRDKELCKPILQLFYNKRSQKRIERIFEILLDEKNDRKANSLERDVLEVVVTLFDEYQDGIIPFNEIWLNLLDKTNGTINDYKKHEMETEIYNPIYKNTLSKMLRDKFGAKDPKTREAKIRSLAFDIEKIKNHLDNYTKDKSPTKITCIQKVCDSSDSSDSNIEELFNNFFSSISPPMINNEEFQTNTPHETIQQSENILHNNGETNIKGLPDTVINVTPVINNYKNDSQVISLHEKVPFTISVNSTNNNFEVQELTEHKKELFDCYYCPDFPTTPNKKDYEIHVVLKHPKKIAYPGLADLKKNNLKPHRKSWEV
jgi:hypothetical protein